MFERIKNLVERLRRKREISMEDFSKIYGAYAKVIRYAWQDMMQQLERERREEERKQIFRELEEIRIYGGSVIPKMAEQILKYKKL